jgi:hypothetical protein
MPSEWDDALEGLGLVTPDNSADPFASEKFANPAVSSALEGAGALVAAPGKLAAANPYAPGSEEAAAYERFRESAASSWAPQTALGMLGGGTGFVRSAPGELALGAAGAGKAAKASFDINSADPTEVALAQIEAALKGYSIEDVEFPRELDIWKADPKALAPGTLVQAGPNGPLGKFQGVSPGGSTLVDWKAGVEETPSPIGAPQKTLSDMTDAEYSAYIQNIKPWGTAQPAGSAPKNMLSDADIEKALASNPGASIFDLAGHSELAPKATPYVRTPVDYSEHLSPIEDWNALTGQHGPSNFEDIGTRERARQAGFNVDLPLFKGGHLADYPEALLDPLGKASEPGVFFSPERRIASMYADNNSPLEYVARSQNPFEVNWPSATGMRHYDDSQMTDIINSARRKGADMLVIRNIGDIGGRQDQYVALDPSIIRRPDAAFDRSKLHLNKLAAGLAGAAASPVLFDEKSKPYVLTK